MGSIESVPAAFELKVADGQRWLSFRAAEPPVQPEQSTPRWAGIETLDLRVSSEEPPRTRRGVAGDERTDPVNAWARQAFANRRLTFQAATLSSSVAGLQQALTACPLMEVGVTELRVSAAGEGAPRLIGRFAMGDRSAAFTIRVAVDPSAESRRRVRISLADVRVFGHLPLPPPLIGAAVARGIALGPGAGGPSVKTIGPIVEVDALELALISALVAHGWRLPDIGRSSLQSFEGGSGALRLTFGGRGHPPDPLAPWGHHPPSPSPLCCIEGERLPEWLATAEDHLMKGQLAAAEGEYRRVLAERPDDRGARFRLLALCAATNADEASSMATQFIAAWPSFLPGYLHAAILAREAGDGARAAVMFAKAATLAEERGEAEDAALARSAEAEAVASIAVWVPPSIPVSDPTPPSPTLAELTDQAVAGQEFVRADELFDQRLALSDDEGERAALTTERARVRLLGPDGGVRALDILRELSLAITPEEGLVLRADLEERLGDVEEARRTLGELVTRAMAAGDLARAFQLSAHQEQLTVAAATEQSPASGGGPADGPSPDHASEDWVNVTAKTEAAYAGSSDADQRAGALGDLLHGFDQLPPERQRAAYASFGRVAESTGDLEHAEEAYWRASRFEGDSRRRADDLHAHARVLLSRGNATAAVGALEQALALVPDHAAVLGLLGEQAFRERDWAQARDLYARLAEAPGSAGVITPEALLFRRAILASAANDRAEAETFYQELAVLDPGHIDAREALGQFALERGDLTSAARYLGEIHHLLPPDAFALLLDLRERLGEIHVGLGEWGAARYYLELALAQDPRRVRTLERLSEVYRHLGLHAEIAGLYEQLSRLYNEPRQRAEALFRVGEISHRELGDEARAFDAYLKSSDLDPGFVPTALRLIDEFWARGQLEDAVDVAEDLRSLGPLPQMRPPVALRLALATALTTEVESESALGSSGDVLPPYWDADLATAALAEAATHLCTRPPHHLEPALTVLEMWRERDNESNSDRAITDDLKVRLRARVTEDPGDFGAARALGWLADREGDPTVARAFFALATFIDETDGAAGRLEELGLCVPPTSACLALGGPADHPLASGPAMPLRRALQALARGLGAFGVGDRGGRGTSPGHQALGAQERDELYALAEIFETPALSLVTAAPVPAGGVPGRSDGEPVAILGAHPTLIEIPAALTQIEPLELTFCVARAFDRLRSGMALVAAATTGSAEDVASLLEGARAALTGAAPPPGGVAQTVAQRLTTGDRTADVVGPGSRQQVVADLEQARDMLESWDAFAAAADRGSDRFALIACRSPLAALRALHARDSLPAAPVGQGISEREQRRAFVRSDRARALLLFMHSAEYAGAVLLCAGP